MTQGRRLAESYNSHAIDGVTMGRGGTDWDRELPPDRTAGVEHELVNAIEEMIADRRCAGIRQWLRIYGRAAGHPPQLLDQVLHSDTALYVWCLSAATHIDRLTHVRECAANRLIQMGHRDLIGTGTTRIALR